MEKTKQRGFIVKLKEIVLYGWDCVLLHENNQGFTITNSQQFQKEVLPLYFEKSNYQSFKRQLNFYGFTCNHNKDGQASFHHQKFNFKLDDQLKRNTFKYSGQSFIEDLLDMETSLKQIRNNQEQMRNQINQIVAIQNSVNSQINHLQKIYLINKINAQSRGKKLVNFLHKFYQNIKGDKYSINKNILEKFLRKNYIKAVQITNYAYNEDYFMKFFSQYEQNISPYKITIYFDFPLNLNQLKWNSQILSIQDDNQEEEEDRLSISNLSNYFNF